MKSYTIPRGIRVHLWKVATSGTARRAGQGRVRARASAIPHQASPIGRQLGGFLDKKRLGVLLPPLHPSPDQMVPVCPQRYREGQDGRIVQGERNVNVVRTE